MGGDETLPHFQVLLGVVDHRFLELLRMCQKELDGEGTPLVEHLRGFIQVRPFACIGSALGALSQIKEQFGGPLGLSHGFPQESVRFP